MSYSFALNVADYIDEVEPKSFKEVLSSRNKQKWIKAMNEVMDSLNLNQTWVLVDKPKSQKVVGCKWIFKRNDGIPGVDEERYKAGLVAQGFSQIPGIDFNEVFSPVVKYSSIRLMLALVAKYDLELEQLDVKTAFLHGKLEETIYIRQPKGYTEKGNEENACLLQK